MFFCKQKTAYEMRISDWSSDVCSSDLKAAGLAAVAQAGDQAQLVGSVEIEFAERGIGLRILAAVHVDIERKGRKRSEERRVGKEWVSTWRAVWSAYY